MLKTKSMKSVSMPESTARSFRIGPPSPTVPRSETSSAQISSWRSSSARPVLGGSPVKIRLRKSLHTGPLSSRRFRIKSMLGDVPRASQLFWPISRTKTQAGSMLGVPSSRFAPTPSMSPGLNCFGNQPSERPSKGGRQLIHGNRGRLSCTCPSAAIAADARTASLNPAPSAHRLLGGFPGLSRHRQAT